MMPNGKKNGSAIYKSIFKYWKKPGKLYGASDFNPTERAILEAIDKRISWWWQILAVAAGLVLFGILLVLVRLVARHPLLLLGGILAAGLVGIFTVIYMFRQARQQIADQEIRIAQLEIFHLEDLIKGSLNE